MVCGWVKGGPPSGPSFPTVTGILDGGAASTSTGQAQTIYSFGYTAATVYDGASNLVSSTDSVMGNWTNSFDTLNRLAGSSISSGTYNGKTLCWAYDAFGNRTMQAMQSTACTSGMTPTASYNANNQLTSALYHYDQAGDVDVDPQNQYLYDAEGRICAVSSPNPLGGTILTGYIYDADGTRVSKGAIQVWNCNPTTSQFATTSDYILGPGGEQFSEYTMTGGAMTWLHTNVWADGRLVATYAQDDTIKSGTTTQSGLLHFYFDDPLGTRRAQTDYAGHLEQTCSSLPFGDSESCGSTPTEHLFTAKERDTESGNDYFEARYYASSMGRFMSPDWSAKEEPVPYAVMDDPQSLNLYAYVRNNPLTRVDADGHDGQQQCDCGPPTPAINPVLPTPYSPNSIPVGAPTSRGTPSYNLDLGAVYQEAKAWVSSLFSSSSNSNAPAPASTQTPATAPATGDSPATTNTNTNPFTGPVANPVTVVDPKGNAIPVGAGQQLAGSKDGKYIQVKDAKGIPTGTRLDGGHKSHVNTPEAQVPHAHVPGQTNANGGEHLPVNQ